VIPIAICTVARPKPYRYATMTSLLASDWQASGGQIHLCIGGPDDTYAQLHAAQRINVHPLTADEWETMRQTSVHTRFNANYRRCLQHAGDEGLIVLEDDIMVRPDWLRCLRLALDEMKAHGHRGFVLSLYYPADIARVHRGAFHQSYFAPSFYGTQALYFAPGLVADVIDHLAATPKRTVDIALRNWFIQQQNVYATIRSLAQHIGYTTTGLAGHMHRAPDFHLPWPAEGSKA
jgi:hypothetical protein